jgi:carbon monoxide dehydrogenase subunit G
MPAEVEIASRVVVSADPERVWRAAVDWPSQYRWMWATRARGGHALGASVVARTGIGPVGFTDTMVITKWDPPNRCIVRHTGRVVRGTGIFVIVPQAESCLVQWTERLQLPLGLVGRLGWPVVRPFVRWGLDSSFRRFRRLIEEADLGA